MPDKQLTYGRQFSPEQTPLLEVLTLARDAGPQVEDLQTAIGARFFATRASRRTLAYNTRLSMANFGLIEVRGDVYTLTPLARALIDAKDDDDRQVVFARHRCGRRRSPSRGIGSPRAPGG